MLNAIMLQIIGFLEGGEIKKKEIIQALINSLMKMLQEHKEEMLNYFEEYQIVKNNEEKLLNEFQNAVSLNEYIDGISDLCKVNKITFNKEKIK